MNPAIPSLLLLLACAAPAAVSAGPAPGAVDPAVVRQIDAHLQFLASDDLGGRETGTLQGLVTGQYVAAAFREAGLQPAGEDGWFQRYPLETNWLVKDQARLVLAAGGGEAALVLGRDWAVRGYASTGFDLSAGLVFAGHGISAPEKGVDHYAGLDVTGRFVVVLDGRPAGRDDLRQFGHWRAKREAAREHGAAGLLSLVADDNPAASEQFEDLLDAADHPSTSMPPPPDAAPRAWPVVSLRGAAAGAALAACGLDVAAERAARAAGDAAIAPGRALQGTLQLVAPVRSERIDGYNVIGRIPGSDPALAHEAVFFTAHMDHIGTLRDGRVNNGADDNASGTTALMVAAAELVRRPAPRRSIVFMAVSGEEKGLLGSEWWCEHPTMPLADVVADINIDMVGRNDPDAIGATPSPQHDDHNTLVTRAVELAPQAGLRVTWTAPAAGDDLVDNYYHRSDHYNFAAKGIPVVFFFSGLHEDYHRPSDDVEKIDREKIARVVQLVSALALDTANADGRPEKVGR